MCPHPSRQEPGPAWGNPRELRQRLWREQPALHLLLQLISCLSLWAWYSLEYLQMFFSPLEKPIHTSYCCRQEHPCQASFPSVRALLSREGSAQQLRVPLGTRTPLPMGVTVSPRPCDPPALHRHNPAVGPVSQTRLR